MALIATQGLWLPSMPLFTLAPAFTSTLIDASGEKVAWVGPYWNKDRATKNITKIGFLPGAITSAGGSQMRLSLQNVDAATGNPFRPDGTQDQTVDFLASAPTASTWYQTGALSATRSLAYGEMVAVVLEFNSFAGADAFNVQSLTGASSSFWGIGGVSHFTSSWAALNVVPNVILEADDGSFGTLAGSWPLATTPTQNANTGSTPDEVALRFTVPFQCKLDGAWVAVSVGAAGRNFDIVLYAGTTALATMNVDAEYMGVNNAARLVIAPLAETVLSPSTAYYLALKPTTASNITTYSFTVSAANHFQAHPGGTEFQYATRTDAGAWTDVTTQRLYGGISISAVHGGGQVIGS